jgi:hypothetical protein
MINQNKVIIENFTRFFREITLLRKKNISSGASRKTEE